MGFPADLIKWYGEHRRSFPWREDGLTPYRVFVAEMLLRKTTAEAVDPVYKDFIKQYPELSSLRAADIEEIAKLLQPLGLHNKRAKAFKNIAEQCPRGLPDTREELLELPHVGPYIADATICFGYGRKQPIIDANVARIYARLLGKDFGTGHQMYRNQELRELIESNLPETDFKEFSWALLDFGAKICTARSPNCEQCFASDYCEYYQTASD